MSSVSIMANGCFLFGPIKLISIEWTEKDRNIRVNVFPAKMPRGFGDHFIRSQFTLHHQLHTGGSITIHSYIKKCYNVTFSNVSECYTCFINATIQNLLSLERHAKIEIDFSRDGDARRLVHAAKNAKLQNPHFKLLQVKWVSTPPKSMW